MRRTGGNHFRAWKQNGSEADTGAWFLAASKEIDARGNHKVSWFFSIVPSREDTPPFSLRLSEVGYADPFSHRSRTTATTLDET